MLPPCHEAIAACWQAPDAVPGMAWHGKDPGGSEFFQDDFSFGELVVEWEAVGVGWGRVCLGSAAFFDDAEQLCGGWAECADGRVFGCAEPRGDVEDGVFPFGDSGGVVAVDAGVCDDGFSAGEAELPAVCVACEDELVSVVDEGVEDAGFRGVCQADGEVGVFVGCAGDE